MRVTIGEQSISLHEFNGRRMSKALQLVSSMEELGDLLKGELDKWREANEQTLDRVSAKVAYQPELLMQPMVVDGEILQDSQGNPILEPMRDASGTFVRGPDPLGHITAEDWAAVDNVWKTSPTPRIGLLLEDPDFLTRSIPKLLSRAEEKVTKVLALCIVSDEEYAQARTTSEKEADDLLGEKADWILDTAKGQQVVKLGLACFELVKDQFKDNVDELMEIVKNALALVGFGPAGEPESERTDSTPEIPTSDGTSQPTSSTPSTPRATRTPKKKPSTARSGGRSSASSPA